MSEPFVGEIRMTGFNFAPVNWMFCDGSLLPISEFDTLFNLIGTTYGGDGQNTFAIPDLRGRVPVHMGGANGYVLGQLGGAENVTLTPSQLAQHTHLPQAAAASSGAPANSPQNNYWSSSTIGEFSAQAPTVSLNAAAVSSIGGSQPHDNLPPYLGINYIISLFGVYPSQS